MQIKKIEVQSVCYVVKSEKIASVGYIPSIRALKKVYYSQ